MPEDWRKGSRQLRSASGRFFRRSPEQIRDPGAASANPSLYPNLPVFRSGILRSWAENEMVQSNLKIDWFTYLSVLTTLSFFAEAVAASSYIARDNHQYPEDIIHFPRRLP